MTSSANALDVVRDSSQEALRAGFDELEKYLRAAPKVSAVLNPREATLSYSSVADDPARVGLDELERLIQDARHHLHRIA
jgi:hypothetical protein